MSSIKYKLNDLFQQKMQCNIGVYSLILIFIVVPSKGTSEAAILEQ